MGRQPCKIEKKPDGNRASSVKFYHGDASCTRAKTRKSPRDGGRGEGVRGLKELLTDVCDYCRTHSFKEIATTVWRGGYWYYSTHPLDLAALVISLIALGVSSAGIVIAILSPR